MEMFQSLPKKIYYAYGVYQDMYDEMKRDIPNIEFISGLPNREDLESWGIQTNGLKLLILDDLLQKASQNSDIVDLFCQYSHHLNFSVFFVTQNLFSQGKQFRTISLNAHYFILFKNQRDQTQIQTLGKQIFTGETKFFMDAYHKATNKKYGYLLLDLSPHSNPQYKLRTNIFPDQITTAYLPKNSQI